jgi:hypothetical protein
VHAEAAAATCTAVAKLTGYAVAAGRRDTELASQVAVMLMATQYDDLADSGYVDQRDTVVNVLQVRLRSSMRAFAAAAAWWQRSGSVGIVRAGARTPQQACSFSPGHGMAAACAAFALVGHLSGRVVSHIVRCATQRLRTAAGHPTASDALRACRTRCWRGWVWTPTRWQC